MCKNCKPYAASFDTSYGSDPATESFPPSAPFNPEVSVGIAKSPNSGHGFGQGYARVDADAMTDADVFPSTKGNGNYNPNHGVAVANTIDRSNATELESDIHEGATVENTTLLIADLEKQLSKAKSESLFLREEVNRLLVTKNALHCNIELLAYQRGIARRQRDFIFNKLMLMTLSRNCLHSQTATLNTENERLRATVDFLKRPFYERWAISLKGRAMVR